MSETVPIHPTRGMKIKMEGVYDLPRVYKVMKEYMIDRKYKYYEDKDITKMRKKGVEVNFKAHGERKIDGYVRFDLTVEIESYYTKKVKYQDKLMDRGITEIIVKGDMILDYKNEFAYNRWGRFLMTLYNKYIIRFKLPEFYAARMYGDMVGMHEAIKEVLELQHI